MSPLFTIGHSTRPIEEFIGLLKASSITVLVDIRTIPKSRHNPQYGQEALKKCLRLEGIEYVYLQRLGGLRSASKDSMNDAWRNKSFRGYADYMQTEDFQLGIEELLALSGDKTVAIMCAEAVPWRCHRSLVADALLVRGAAVQEIISATSMREHTLTDFAVVDGTSVTYPKSALKDP